MSKRKPSIYTWNGRKIGIRPEAIFHYWTTYGIPPELFPELLNSVPYETRLRILKRDLDRTTKKNQ